MTNDDATRSAATGAADDDARARRADCERLAVEAGALVKSRFGAPGEIVSKPDPTDSERLGDVVTEVDYLSEQLLLRGIFECSSSAVVLAEEGGVLTASGVQPPARASDADELWLVDPLDGTINFSHGIPHFCVSVACWRGGRPVAGAIVDPMVGETFSFEHSGASSTAYVNGIVMRLPAQQHASTSVLLVGGGVPQFAPLARRFRSWRRIGSAALALAWTGAGRSGAYVQFGGLHPWDWGVGVPFLQAAGGRVVTGSGAPWTASFDETTGLIVGSPSIHAEIVELAAAAAARTR